MTVRELIKALGKCDRGKQVMVDRGAAYADALSVEEAQGYVFVSDEPPGGRPELEESPGRCTELEWGKSGRQSRRCTRDAGHRGIHFWGNWVEGRTK